MLSVNVCALGSVDYVVGSDGEEISIPQTHIVADMVRYMGDEGGFLSQPSDLFVDSKDYVFIADTGNNRIVKLDPDCNYVCSYDCGGTLSQPGGVFVTDNGDIYVADTLNERIVHMSADGEYIEEFVKPESDLIDDDQTFQISKIGITSQGYLYTIHGQYFMMIDANNQFKGYVGDNRLGFSLTRLLIRLFASKEQQDKLIKETPTSYSSFDIGPDGLIYATTGEDASTNQIQKINMVGENIFPSNSYGKLYYNKDINRYINPRLVDICVDGDGLIYTVDAYSCNIFVYDQEGNMLAYFAGKGSVKGRFSQPAALDTQSGGNLLVLDEATGYIHIFERTGFMDSITEAVAYYNNGEYSEAEEAWRRVLDTDVNYPVANKGIGDALYKQDKIDEAMEYYRLSESKSGYGAAFSEYQYNFFKEHFGIVVLAAVVICAAVIFTVYRLKKRSDRFVGRYYSGGKTDE